MNIIAHRGLWKSPEQKNSMAAFKRAIDAGFGIETDVREYCGRLVLSHDVADERSVSCEELFRYCAENRSECVLALNVKEDGIQKMLAAFSIRNYFLFDMSVPEMVVYRQMGMPYFTRQSDIERVPVLLEDAAGVWMDAFFTDWDMVSQAEAHLRNGRQVSLISPELHGKDEAGLWERLRESGIANERGCFLCTDYPERAKEYFGG